MPAGSSDGSLSRATSASSPVLTSGLACGPDAQRANGLVEKRVDEALRREIGPVDRWGGPGNGCR